ncbi:MAG: 3-hydroxyacyl-ACP dehydratase FabZ [Lachnospiraceae bacterium]|nr:3-hydroxyacyl-ACP dehydratase FabZ [Lachnospiraceae bacterium]
MDREELKKILPHREPMLLVDEADVTKEGGFEGRYTVKGDEFFLQGHFPGNPIVPGVILCEMMAQSAVVMFADRTEDPDTLFVYTGINNVKFRKSVLPGDTVIFRGSLTREKKPFYFIHGEAYVGDKKCMEGDFSFAQTKKNA